MTTTTELPPPSPPPPPPPRRLLRSSSDRYVAGVAGGLGRYTGLDPVIFRVVLAVLAVFGGTGIVLYLAAWLVRPEDNGRPAGIDRMLRRPSGERRSAAAVVVGIVAAAILVAIIADGDDHVVVTLLVLGGLAFLVARQGLPSGPDGPAVDPSWTPAGAGPAAAASATEAGEPTWPAYSPDTPPAWPSYSSDAPAAWTPPPPRPPSFLTPLTISTMLIVTGVAVALDRADVLDIGVTGMLATLLVITGVGLLVATRYGRARGLLPVGLVLALATAASTVGDIPLDEGVGEQTWTPRTVAELEAEYRHGVGEAELDLSRLADFQGTERVAVTLGVGELKVVVPDGVDLDIRAEADAGAIRIFGETADGRHAELRTVRNEPGTDRLVLDLDVTLGEVEVDRAES